MGEVRHAERRTGSFSSRLCQLAWWHWPPSSTRSADAAPCGAYRLSIPSVGQLSEFVTEYIDRVVNRRETTVVAELVAADYRGSGLGWPATRDELLAFYEEQARSRPDWHIEVEATVELGDSVVVRAHAHGTVTDGGRQTTRHVEWLTHYRVSDGRIGEINVLAVAPVGDR